MNIRLPLTLFAASLVGWTVERASANEAIDPYAGRDGATEALTDIAQGKPSKIYYRSLCGDSCRFHGVGIANCEPERFDTEGAPKGFFASIPEASGSSGEILTPEQRSRQHSAYLFAKDYNLAMFGQRKSEILKNCPQAEVEDEEFAT